MQIHDNHYSSLLAFMTHGVEHMVCGLGARYMSGKCLYVDTTFRQAFFAAAPILFSFRHFVVWLRVPLPVVYMSVCRDR